MSNEETNLDTPRTFEELKQQIDERFATSYDTSIWSKGWSELLLYGLSVLFFAYHLWYGFTAQIPRNQHGVIHLALVLVAWAILKLFKTNRDTSVGKLKSAGYAIYAILSVVPLYYLASSYQQIVFRSGSYTSTDLIMGTLLLALILIALYSVSRLITGIAVVGLVYSYFGPLMPGILNHRGLSPIRIVTANTVEFQGVLGQLLQISATWVVIFLMLAGLLEKYGGMSTFIKGMSRLAMRYKYIAIGQVAVAASAALGSINGSTAANTATTGTFTIPLMKENGYPPRVAAATEAVASCGGQVLPPIMGAGAFLMAELIEPTYSEIIIAATLPAILFFLTVGVAVSWNTPESEIEAGVSDSHTLFDQLMNAVRSVEYISMFIVLLYYLIVVQSDPMLAGFYGIVTLAGVRFLRSVYQGVSEEDTTVDVAVRRFSRDTLEGMRRGVEATINITIILASLGIVVRALIVTGFAQQLSTQMIILANGEILVLLVLAMAASIVFGMGMSTTAAYTLVATLVAPALTSSGFEPLLGHFFVFYFAIVSNITPPIALSIVIAQGIADSGFTETTISAMKIGFPMLLLPYAFAFNPALLNISPMSLVAFFVVLIGFVAIAAGAAGRISSNLSLPVRIGFGIFGLATVFAPVVSVQVLLAMLTVGGIAYFTMDIDSLLTKTTSPFS